MHGINMLTLDMAMLNLQRRDTDFYHLSDATNNCNKIFIKRKDIG